MSAIPISEKMKTRAMHPRLEFGYGLIRERSRSLGRYLLITAPPVWNTVEKMISRSPAQVLFVNNMDRQEIEQLEKGLPSFDTIAIR